MDSLPINTKHRLKRIPQIPHVWEGDRLPVAGMMDNLEPDLVENGECIIWVDGSEGFVRSMEVVRANTGLEAMVRSLLKAIETPHSPAQPARPQKIVVKNRELQFFLRGALQDLDIQVDYKSELPLLDELWNNFQNLNQNSLHEINPQLMESLKEIALTYIWEQQPWEILGESNILKIELEKTQVDTLYACVMGMMGQEFGIILYRCWDSLKKFRQLALEIAEDASEIEIESAFLNQDCWFINFVPFEDEQLNLNAKPIFGSIHPYEGINPLKDEEEIIPIALALEALGLFFQEYEEELESDLIPHLNAEYYLTVPQPDTPSSIDNIKVAVATVPQLTAELEEMLDDYNDDLLNDDEYDEEYEDEDQDEDDFILSDDLIPEGSIISFAVLSADLIEQLYLRKNIYYPDNFSRFETLLKNQTQEKGLPSLLIQTSRPKAQVIIEQLQQEGGLTYVLFNQGLDLEFDTHFNLGIIQTQLGNFYLCCQQPQSHSSFQRGLEKWKKQVALCHNNCGVAVAMGVTGQARGNPEAKHILGFFPAKFVEPEEVGLTSKLFSE